MAAWRRTASIIGLFGIALSAAAAERLPRLHALTDEWTVSGLSSGAYMAVQIAVAHSGKVRGVGAFAGGLLVSVAESLGAVFLAPSMKEVVSFALLVVILLLRPAGLFGRSSL